MLDRSVWHCVWSICFRHLRAMLLVLLRLAGAAEKPLRLSQQTGSCSTWTGVSTVSTGFHWAERFRHVPGTRLDVISLGFTESFGLLHASGFFLIGFGSCGADPALFLTLGAALLNMPDFTLPTVHSHI